jgi:DNA polymerase-3 subunit gamma/tau
MLLSQQASLLRLDQQRAVVRVSGKWIAMVQSRLPLLESALHQALGSPRQVLLEASDQPSSSPIAAPPIEAKPAVEAAAAPAVVPGPSASAPAAISQELAAARTPPPGPIKDGPSASADRPEPQLLDDQARRLADFFNGEVVNLED